MRAIATAQPNIALIKYWGKRDTRRNLPAVGSISITLADLETTMGVEFDDELKHDVLTVNGSDNVAMLPRVSRCIDSMAGRDRPAVRVTSSSNFPIAAGLASSASAFAALVVATDAALGKNEDRAALASLAGCASGSAARSLFGGFVELRNTPEDVELDGLCAAEDWPLRVVVAIISRKTSPFYARWIEQQPQDLDEARVAITERDFARLAAVAEHNCLKMHSVMWGSRPPMIYWNSATLACMQTVRELQAQGVAVFFTIDAGPQLKAVCEPAAETKVRDALGNTAGVEKILSSGLGAGARRVGND
jgi:diphosphomevalonate decarboxylase